MLEAEPDALIAAVLHQQPLQKLLRAGADPIVRDQAGLTPLHHAVLVGNVDAVVALLDHAGKCTRPVRKAGGEPSRAPGSPWHLATAPGPPPCRPSPLHLAAERSEGLLRLILSHSSLTSVAASFLGIVISSRPQPELLHLRDARGWSLLHYAVSRANLATMRLLLPHMGANVAELGSGSSSRSSSAGGAAPPHGHVRVTCGVNVPDAAGRTALHQAAHLGQADCCRLLLKAGADQSLASSPPECALPLHLAAAGNCTAAIEILFRHAVNQAGFRAAQTVLLRPNAAGLTALHVAVQHGAVDAARKLLNLVFPFDTRGPLGRTALHLAALLGDTLMISMLLGHSTPQQRQLCDAEGFTALHLAAATGRLDALRVLVAGGCGVNSRAEATPHAPGGCEGWTPLHCAVRRGDVAAIELLISELGADPHAKDACGRTPYDLAVAVGGDDSRQGSSVVGTGSGIHNLDDAQWATEATGTESEEGGRRSGGGSSEHRSSATARGGSGALATMAVDPLQGPSGISSTASGCGGVMRLDEAQALAVLQTFIRLLHDPLRLSNGLPSVAVSVPDDASAQTVNYASRAPLVNGACECCGAHALTLPSKRLAAAGWNAAALAFSGPAELSVSGRATAPEALTGAGPKPGQAPSDGPGPGTVQVAAGDAGAALGDGDQAAAAPSSRQVQSIAPSETAGEEGRIVVQRASVERPGLGGAAAGGAAAAKLNGHAQDHEGGRLPSPAAIGGQAPSGGKSGSGAEVTSSAPTYAAHVLSGPAATPTRASPFSKRLAHRPSPFSKMTAVAAAAPGATGFTAATASGATLGAMSADRTTPAGASVSGGGDGGGGIDTGSTGAAAFASRTASAETATPSASGSVAPTNNGAALVTKLLGPTNPATTSAALPSPTTLPVTALAATKRSPFAVSAKASPFTAAANARPAPPANPLAERQTSAQSQLQPRPQDPVDGDVLKAAEAVSPPRPSATGAPLGEGVPPAGAPAEVSLPATEPAQWGATPFTTAAAAQQRASLPDSLPLGPVSDPAALLCVVSAINSPCGFSALNRAILLQRNTLAEALLATLPPQGHQGGVLVLAPPPSGGGGGAAAVAAAGRGTAATVAYQLSNTPNGGAAGAAPASFQSKTISPSTSRQHLPLTPATSSEVADGANGICSGVCSGGGPRLAPSRITSANPAFGTGASARPHTPPRHQASKKQLLRLLHQLNGGDGSSPSSDGSPAGPATGDVANTSSRAASPLLPLLVPGGAPPVSISGAPGGASLIPGLVHWDEATDVFRTQAANHTGRAWLYWPGEPDPSTGWLVAELAVVEAGAAGGHVWLGMGPRPEALAAFINNSSNSSSNNNNGGGRAAGTPATASGLATAAPAPALLSGGKLPGRAAAPPPVPIPVAMCPVMNHPSTHVACLRDGQAFRGGVQTVDLGTATRLEARSGDVVAMFWNRHGRSVAFTLNGRYCGRLSGVPANAQLTPLVGMQCGAFVFKWRCCSRVGADGGGGGGSSAPEPYTCPSCTSNIDGMLIREQMLHEDPETPWLCKPSMNSLHFAAWSGNVRVLHHLLLVKGFSPDEPDVDGWTPLHFAALGGQDEAVRLLLSLHCQPDKKSKYGSTPAMLTAKYGRSPEHVAIVRILSDAGAQLDVRDPRGRTLLMLAARAGSLAMVQLLLDRGLDPSATDALDREAQQYAGQHAAIFRLFRNAQAAQRAGARKGMRQQQQHRKREIKPQQPVAAATVVAAAAAAVAPAKQQVPEAAAADDDDDSGDADADVDIDGGFAGRGRDVDVQHLPLLAERWRVGTGQLVRGRLIEQGAFGAVFEGTWCGTRVAIKQVMRRWRRASPRSGDGDGGKGGEEGEEEEEEEEPEAVREAQSLEREVAILAALPPHERIARMLGSVKLPGDGMCLVMAYYPHTLQGVMQSERLRRSWLTPSRRAAIARQIAEGLGFLHGLPGPRVIHRDLKPNNVLLEAAPALGVKICDFGLSRILAGNDVQSSSAAGHAFWMAPELLRAQSYDEKVDVYSYGVILYQLAYWVDDQLYGGLNKAQVDFQVVHGILRLQDRLPSGIDAAVQELVYDCVDENPRNRPSMGQVLERLASVRELPQPGHGGTGVHAAAAVVAAGGLGELPARPTAGGTAAATAGGDPEHHRQC